MRALFLLFGYSLLVSSVSAHAANDRISNNFSFDYREYRQGRLLFPIATCPDIGKEYEELTEKLGALKTSIKSSANCRDAQAKVNDFSSLVDKDRNEFLSLIQKGKTAPLTDEDTKKIHTYFESLTRTAGVVTDLTVGSSCFKDDKRGYLTSEVVASLVNESANAIGALSGPYGPLFGLTGQIASSLITSIDQLVRTRQAYDFHDPDQRKIFVKTMCAYNGIRRDIDDITRAAPTMDDIRKLMGAITKQLDEMNKLCSECAAISKQFGADFTAGAAYINEPTAIVLENFKALVQSADDRFVYTMGTQTVINLKSRVFLNNIYKRLDKGLNDLGDIERDHVSQVQNSIEEFLFVKWLPKFVSYYQKEMRLRLDRLDKTLIGFLQELDEIQYDSIAIMDSIIFVPVIQYTPNMVNTLFTSPPTKLGKFKNTLDKESFIINAQGEADRQIADLVSSLMIIEKTCQFARSSNSKYEVEMYKVCDQQENDLLTQVYDFLWLIKLRTHRNSTIVAAVFEVPGPGLLNWAELRNVQLPQTGFIWSANWLQSLYKQVEQVNPDLGELFKLK